jgi:peptidoglycan/LPS O-acetylase OafA/YrhL
MTSTTSVDVEQPLPEDPPSVRRTIHGLDGVRALAAGLVMVFHFRTVSGVVPPEPLDLVIGNGWVGVDIFFAISGFILFLPWARAHHDHSLVSRRRYFRNRALRILPAYWFNLFVLVALSASGLLFTLPGLRTLLLNATFTASYVRPGTWTLVNGVAWTLFCEVVFYLLLPFLARLFVGRRWVLGLPLVVAVCMTLRWEAIHAYADPASHVALQQSLFNIGGTLDEFAMGMTMGAVWARLEFSRRVLPRWSPIVLVVAGLAGIWGTLWLLQDVVGPSAYWNGAGPWAWLPLMTFKPIIAASAAVFILGICYQPNLVGRVFSTRALVYLGTISYGLYLWHLPLATRMVSAMPRAWSPTERFLVLVVVGTLLTCAWAAVSFHFVESRFLAAKRPTVQRPGP